MKIFYFLLHFILAEFVNALRWWKNIASYKAEFGSLPAGSAAAAADEEEDDDDVDLFGSDDEEEDAEAERIKVFCYVIHFRFMTSFF